MAKPRALDKRRKAIRNIRKITRTMELIATARFKRAMDRAVAATAYTRRITQLVADLTRSGLEVRHPLLMGRAETRTATLLVLTSNRGLCGGYNANVHRLALARWEELARNSDHRELELSGKRGISAFRYRKIPAHRTYTHFEDRPRFEEVELLANRFLDAYMTGQLDRLDVAYTKFESASRQFATVETLLPLGSLDEPGKARDKPQPQQAEGRGESWYEFLPSAAGILEEIVPASFKVRLFKCFLDAAVSEQIARMVAMKSATENATELIREISLTYNRARQAHITREITEIVGGAEAVKQ